MRACSSGRLEGVSSTRIASRGSRVDSAASTWPARSGMAGRRGGGDHPLRDDRLARGAGTARDERGADRRRLADDRDLRRAAVRLGRIVGDHRRRACPARPAAPRRTGTGGRRAAPTTSTTSCGASASRSRGARRQVPGEQRMVLREAGAAAERLLPHGAAEVLGQRDQGRPALLAVGARADHDRRPRRAPRAARRAPRRRPGRPPRSASAICGRSSRAARPRARTSRPSARSRSPGPRPVAASWWARTIAPGTSCARAGWSSTRGSRRPAREPAGQERLERQVAAVLLADEHHQRRAVGARGGERGDRVAEARASSAAARAPGGRGRARSPPPSPPRSPRAGRARTSRSSGRPARNGTSVEPGLENIVVSSRRRRTSNVASRTVGGAGVTAGLGTAKRLVFGVRAVARRSVRPPCVTSPQEPAIRRPRSGASEQIAIEIRRWLEAGPAAGRAHRHRAGDGRRVRRQPADDARGAAPAVRLAPDPRQAAAAPAACSSRTRRARA